MSERNKAHMRRAVDVVWNGGDFSRIDEFVTSDFVIHTSAQGGDIHGTDGICQFFGSLRAAFPDLHFTIEDQVAEGDRVVTRWVAQGTHLGEFQGIPATGKQLVLSGIDIDRLADGKAVECWSRVDELGLLKQLGVLDAPVPAG